MSNPLEGTRALTQHWAGLGALRPGLEAPEAAETLWLLASTEQFHLATDQVG